MPQLALGVIGGMAGEAILGPMIGAAAGQLIGGAIGAVVGQPCFAETSTQEAKETHDDPAHCDER